MLLQSLDVQIAVEEVCAFFPPKGYVLPPEANKVGSQSISHAAAVAAEAIHPSEPPPVIVLLYVWCGRT